MVKKKKLPSIFRRYFLKILSKNLYGATIIVVFHSAPSMDQIALIDHLTMCKQMTAV